MQLHMRSKNYIGEGVNSKGKSQIHFRLGKQYMVVGVTKDLFYSVDQFDDLRPVRAITTVFFSKHCKLDNSTQAKQTDYQHYSALNTKQYYENYGVIKC